MYCNRFFLIKAKFHLGGGYEDYQEALDGRDALFPLGVAFG